METLPPELSHCDLRRSALVKDKGDPSFGCALELDCGERVRVGCDPEDDGTQTSLCDCEFERDGKRSQLVQGQLFQGEGAAPCRTAAIACLALRAERAP